MSQQFNQARLTGRHALREGSFVLFKSRMPPVERNNTWLQASRRSDCHGKNHMDGSPHAAWSTDAAASALERLPCQLPPQLPRQQLEHLLLPCQVLEQLLPQLLRHLQPSSIFAA